MESMQTHQIHARQIPKGIRDKKEWMERFHRMWEEIKQHGGSLWMHPLPFAYSRQSTRNSWDGEHTQSSAGYVSRTSCQKQDEGHVHARRSQQDKTR